MRRILLTALLIGAALAPAAVLSRPATAADTHARTSGPKRACFYSEDLRNWKSVDDNTVNILVGGKQVFQLKLMGSCPDLDTAETIGVKTRMGQGFICDGTDIDLIVPGPVGPRRCPAANMRELSPAEVAALPKKQQP